MITSVMGCYDQLWYFAPGPCDAAVSHYRPYLLAGPRTQASNRGRGVHVLALATEVSDSFFGGVGRIGDEYVKALYRFAEAYGIPVVHFKKGQNKEEIACHYLETAAKEGKERVVMIGIAQEKEVLQLCSRPVIGWPDASPGLFEFAVYSNGANSNRKSFCLRSGGS